MRFRFIIFIIFFTIHFQLTSAQNFWEQTNGPFGGSINSFTISYSNEMYAGTDKGSVLHSTNDGNDWQLTNSAVTGGGGVTALASNPLGDIFVGTDYGGVYRSTNFGES